MAEAKAEALDRHWWNHTSFLAASEFNAALAAMGSEPKVEARQFNPWIKKPKEKAKPKPFIDRAMSRGLPVRKVSPDAFVKAEK